MTLTGRLVPCPVTRRLVGAIRQAANLNLKNMTNKKETIKGRLLQFFNEWKVQSGYGTFPLTKSLQSKPTVSLNGSPVEAIILHGEVIDYHFIDDGEVN